jgi:uncharacterized protein YjbI with pentapeptide repeats
MNFKLLTATTLFLTLGTAIPAFSYSEQDISSLKRTRQCLDCNLSNVTPSTSSSLYLSQQDLRNTNLQGANLSNTWLYKSDLRNANLSRTNSKAVNFEGADLRNVNFSHADISGANLCEADLRGINWTGVIYNKETKCLPDEAINYVPTANNPTPTVPVTPVAPVEAVAPVIPAVTENPASIQDTLNGVRQNVNTVRDILNIFR